MLSPHVLAIPFPAQGHVIPFLELSQCLVTHGCRVTFVNTDYDHKRVVDALGENSSLMGRIRLVSIPDGMDPSEDRNILSKLLESIAQVMPGKLQELIEKIIAEGDKIDCLIGDGCLGFAMEVAKKMNIRRATFWPASVASLAISLRIPQFIADGIIDNDGMAMKKEMVQLRPQMPKTSSEHLLWSCTEDASTQKAFFNTLCWCNEDVKKAEFWICNSTYDLEPEALALIPKILPIGPLLASNRLGTSMGSYWQEDQACLEWLDKQAINSVVFIAFGSFTIFDPIQFQELALGLVLSNRPFLWAVRPDKNVKFSKGFEESLATRGQVTGWAPQQKVLSHPSIVCFVSHCGWNSTLEGVSNGVPFLCWPYFGDQYGNESYVCDVWKVGLRLEKNENGIVTKGEIKSKVDKLLSDDGFKVRSSVIKEKTSNCLRQSGNSNRNFQNFIRWMKGRIVNLS